MKKSRHLSNKKSEHGYVIALTAISIGVLLGITGFSVDLGNWYLHIDRAQKAADAAALAGAVYLPDDPDKAKQVAMDLLASNDIPEDVIHAADIYQTSPNGELYVGIKTTAKNSFLPFLGLNRTTTFHRYSVGLYSKNLPESSTPVATDFAIVLDFSRSMRENDPEDSRLVGAAALVDSMGVDDQAAIIDFAGTAVINQPMTNDKTLLVSAINNPADDLAEMTSLGAGLESGIQALQSSLDDGKNHVVVFLTDGNNTTGKYDPNLETVAQQSGIVIYTIGLSEDADADTLSEMAQNTGGAFRQVNDASILPEVFKDIFKQATSKTPPAPSHSRLVKP